MAVSSCELAVYPPCAALNSEQIDQAACVACCTLFIPGTLLMSCERPSAITYLLASDTLHVLIDLHYWTEAA